MNLPDPRGGELPPRPLPQRSPEVSMTSDSPDLLSLFSAMYDHYMTGLVEYHLQGDAFKMYEKTHDELVDLKIKTTNENTRDPLKSKRILRHARIAMVIHCLEQALERIDDNVDENFQLWESLVTPKACRSSSSNYSPPESSEVWNAGYQLYRPCWSRQLANKQNDALVVSGMALKRWHHHTCRSSQKHISEKVGPSYPSLKALDMLRQAESLGYGEMKETTAANYYRSQKERPQRTYCVESLKKVKLSEEITQKISMNIIITEE